jgi:hypothetical protein
MVPADPDARTPVVSAGGIQRWVGNRIPRDFGKFQNSSVDPQTRIGAQNHIFHVHERGKEEGGEGARVPAQHPH